MPAPRRDPRHDVLFEPVRIGPKVLRNRFYQVPHCSGRRDRQAVFSGRASGDQGGGRLGGGLHRVRRGRPGSDEAPAIPSGCGDDEDARALAVACESVHEHGALIGIELHHSGVHAPCGETRRPAFGPSQLASDYEPFTVPKAMERADIRRVQAEWVQAARRARDVGFDIIYVDGAHSLPAGSVPLAVLQPTEPTEYGGSFENRSRFWLELLEQGARGGRRGLRDRVQDRGRCLLGPAGVELGRGGLAFVERR